MPGPRRTEVYENSAGRFRIVCLGRCNWRVDWERPDGSISTEPEADVFGSRDECLGFIRQHGRTRNVPEAEMPAGIWTGAA